MTTVHPSNAFNVEATINQWMAQELALITRPAWLPTMPALIYDMPEGDLPTPCFSLFHLPVSDRRLWMGDAVGDGLRGLQSAALLDIKAWVNRQNPNWLAQIRAMGVMVKNVVTVHPVVVITDWWNDPTGSTSVNLKINLRDLDPGEIGDDPNPDLMVQRMLLRYEWVTKAYT